MEKATGRFMNNKIKKSVNNTVNIYFLLPLIILINVIHIMEAIEIGITAYTYESLISKAGDRCVKLSTIKGAEPTMIKKQNNITNRFVRVKTIFLFFLLRKLVKISTPICKPFDSVIAAPKKITQINKKIVISPAQGRAEFNKYRKIT